MLKASLALLLATSGCARPTLPVELDGDIEQPPEEDAGDEAATDAGLDSAPPEFPDAAPLDAEGCADRDDDGVCDADDNCPDARNTDQADADRDGVGDACQKVEPVSCDGAANIPATVDAGEAELRNVRVNGESGVVNVQRGASFQVQLNYEFDGCTYPVQQRYLNIGIEGGGRRCNSLPESTCGVSDDGSTTLTVTAPSSPGLHYVVARGVQPVQFVCSDNVSGPVRIAAICVQ